MFENVICNLTIQFSAKYKCLNGDDKMFNLWYLLTEFLMHLLKLKYASIKGTILKIVDCRITCIEKKIWHVIKMWSLQQIIQMWKDEGFSQTNASHTKWC